MNAPLYFCCGSLLVAPLLLVAVRWLDERIARRNDFWRKNGDQ